MNFPCILPLCGDFLAFRSHVVHQDCHAFSPAALLWTSFLNISFARQWPRCYPPPPTPPAAGLESPSAEWPRALPVSVTHTCSSSSIFASRGAAARAQLASRDLRVTFEGPQPPPRRVINASTAATPSSGKRKPEVAAVTAAQRRTEEPPETQRGGLGRRRQTPSGPAGKRVPRPSLHPPPGVSAYLNQAGSWA